MRAFVLGGSGLIGRAIARRLIEAGWDVDLLGRDRSGVPTDLLEAGVGFVAAERGDRAAIGSAFGSGAELLVDCVCFTGAHASALLPLARLAASTVMISSKAVYVDAVGRHVNSEQAPRFDGPIRETEPTVAASWGNDFDTRFGYGPNKVAAEQVLLDSGLPVSVIRASKVHGEGARPPREWVFIKRVLDRRPAVLLAHRGAGVDHPTAAANLAALVETVATNPGGRILNSADPDAPSGLQIARTIARYLNHEWEEIGLEDDVDERLGPHPWDRPHPIVLDLTASAALGYTPVGDYAQTVRAEVDWLVAQASRSGPVELPPGYADSMFDALFDYEREDRYLADR